MAFKSIIRAISGVSPVQRHGAAYQAEPTLIWYAQSFWRGTNISPITETRLSEGQKAINDGNTIAISEPKTFSI
jgi:hypothetical protein